MVARPATIARGCAQHARTALMKPFHGRPAQRRRRRREWVCGKRAGGERARVSALPALKPNQPTHSNRFRSGSTRRFVRHHRLCG